MIVRRASLLLLFSAILLICSCGFFKTDIPDLSANELRKMMDGDANPIVIDTRTQFEFARGRILRSLFVPEEKFYALKLILPPEKDAVLVFYCRGPG